HRGGESVGRTLQVALSVQRSNVAVYCKHIRPPKGFLNCLSELATHGSGLAQTPIMFAFNPFIGVLAKSFNLFRKNFSGWVDSLRSALPIPGISGVSTKALGRPGLFGWYEVLRITLAAGWPGGARVTAAGQAGGDPTTAWARILACCRSTRPGCEFGRCRRTGCRVSRVDPFAPGRCSYREGGRHALH